MSMQTKGKVKEAIMTAVITRADGTTEDLGTIAYYHRSWFRRLIHRLLRR